jgi:hypothetical protein
VKLQLREWLACSEFHKIIDAALNRDRTLSALITLAYDADPLIGWRALDAIGRCAERLSPIRPESLKKYLRRLFWLMSDESGAVARHAPVAIGEIIRSDPQQFGDFIPMAVSLLDLEPEDRPLFLPGTLYALGRIGEADPTCVQEGLPLIAESLAETDLQARAMAIWCLGRLGAVGMLLQHPEMAQDLETVLVYREERLMEITISFLFAEAIRAIRSPVFHNTSISEG